MVAATILNSIGLSINVLGGLMMFWGTPRVTSDVWIYTDAEQKALFKKDKLKNQVIKLGFVLLSLGTVTQLVALWI